jgi:transposase
MEERLRFVARLLEGEAMTDLCLEFGISRKTGYKLFNRYKEEGSSALTDRSRRPVRYANQLPAPAEQLIVEGKREKPHWRARRIRELLVRRFAGEIRIPATSTVHAVLDCRGRVCDQGLETLVADSLNGQRACRVRRQLRGNLRPQVSGRAPISASYVA